MEVMLFMLEKSLLICGLFCILTALLRYGRRSSDWRGVLTVFYKRVPLTVSEFKFYRLGVALLCFAIVLRIGLLAFYPAKIA